MQLNPQHHGRGVAGVLVEYVYVTGELIHMLEPFARIQVQAELDYVAAARGSQACAHGPI